MRLRSYLMLLAIAAALPVVIFAGAMVYLSHEERRENVAHRLQAEAHAITDALDREFLASIQSLKVLGASTRLEKGQLSEFYGDMKAALEGYRRAWQNLTLTDADGQQLINLRRPFGAPLPATGNPAAIEEARIKKQPVIADLSPGPVTGALGLVVHVPVMKEERVKYVLNAIFYPDPLAELLAQQRLPPRWTAMIIDRSQVVAAQTGDAKKYIGKPAPTDLQANAQAELKETRRAVLLDGTEVLAALHRSSLTGWTVAVASPVHDIEGPLKDALLLTGAGGLMLLLVAAALAMLVGRRIARPVAGLVAAADQLGAGEALNATAPSRIQEIDRVARALEEAGRKRREAEDALRQSEAQIRQLNRIYAVLSDINQAIVRIRDPQALLSRACEIAVEKGGFRLAWVGLVDGATGRVEPRAFAGVNDGYVERLSVVAGDPASAQGPTARALRTGRRVVCNDIESDPQMGRWREEALRRGYRCAAVFPLKIGDEVLGTFNLYASQRGLFSEAEVVLLEEMAADIGFFLESHRRDQERLRAEASLRESEERFRQLAENISGVFWLSTADRRRVIYVSSAYEKLWGRSCQSLYESPGDWLNAVHPEDRERVFEAAHPKDGSGAYEIEYRIVRPDGEIRWVRARAFPVRDAQGSIYRVAGIADDVTERKEAEEAVRKARDELEERVAERTRELAEANLRLRDLDRLKSEFLANMSHELRTPLNAIIGFSQLMYDGKAGGPLSAEHREYVGDILQSGKHLLQLINDVLDLSKVEAGRAEVLKSVFRVEDVVFEVVQNVAPLMSLKGLKLIRDLPDDLPPVNTDRRKVLQILLNLVSNAVKFTDQGQVTIGARMRRAPASASQVSSVTSGAPNPKPDTWRVTHETTSVIEFSVSDTGVGIKTEDLPLLFQPFSQVDSSLRKRHEGTGLGLYLSKKLAELLGGEIVVESEYGKGSTFTVQIPVEEA